MKILLLEDHHLFAMGLNRILVDHYPNLDIRVFHSVKDVPIRQIDLATIDLMISDIEIPNEDVFQLIEDVKVCRFDLPILVLSMHNKLSAILRCQKLGVEGYMLKDDNEILKAVGQILQGKPYYSKKVIETLSILDDENTVILSPREEEIIKWVANGKSNSEMADLLFVSPNTIATHRRNINRKLQLTNPAEITKYYFENYIS